MKLNLAALLLMCALMSSCSVMAIRKHEPNFKSTREITKIKGSYKVGTITASDPELAKLLHGSHFQCRMTTFEMPANKTVEDFLRDSFSDELDAAGKISPNGVPINVEVKKLESSTGFGQGKWTLDFIYNLGGNAFEVKTGSEFESAFAADTACRNTASAFSDAVGENFVTLTRKITGKK